MFYDLSFYLKFELYNLIIFLLFIVGVWWRTYGARAPNLKNLPSESLAKLVALLDVSVIGVSLIKYTQRNALGKKFIKAIKFIVM